MNYGQLRLNQGYWDTRLSKWVERGEGEGMNIVEGVISDGHIGPLLERTRAPAIQLASDLAGIEHQLVSVVSQLSDDAILDRVDVLDLEDQRHDEFGTAS